MVQNRNCWNLRDLGGLTGAGGRRIRRGQVFRAAAPFRAAADDIRPPLADLHLVRIFDMRTDMERARHADTALDLGNLPVWRRDYAASSADLRGHLAAGRGEDLREGMLEAYRRLPVEQAPAVSAILSSLARDEMPILFHCAVGKDRTGAVAALLLTLLGVSREQIFEDYLLTNLLEDRIRSSLLRHPLLQLDRAVEAATWTALSIADPCYLDAMFAALDDDFGGVTGYLDDVLGIEEAARDRIRGHLLD
jgi:protein-tyrosine phosphatase